MRKCISLVVAAALAAGLLAGCGGSASGAKGQEGTTTATGGESAESAAGQMEAASDAKAGGTLKIGVNTECVHTMLSFDLTGAGVDYYYSWPVYESLFKPNAEGTVDPWLLEDYSYDPEALTYTFHVRKGVTFDGTYRTRRRRRTPDHLEVGAKVEALLSSIESVEVVDGHTSSEPEQVRVSIPLYAFSANAVICSHRTSLRKRGGDKGTPCVAEFLRIDKLGLRCIQDLYQEGRLLGRGRKAGQCGVYYLQGCASASAALQSGEIDAILALNAECGCACGLVTILRPAL